jgi:hypothetical protein
MHIFGIHLIFTQGLNIQQGPWAVCGGGFDGRRSYAYYHLATCYKKYPQARLTTQIAVGSFHCGGNPETEKSFGTCEQNRTAMLNKVQNGWYSEAMPIEII